MGKLYHLEKEGANMRILDFLKKGTLIELIGTPFAKAYSQEDGFVRTEIRLNVAKTNILRPAKATEGRYEAPEFDEDGEEYDDSDMNDFTIDEDDF